MIVLRNALNLLLIFNDIMIQTVVVVVVLMGTLSRDIQSVVPVFFVVDVNRSAA